MTEEQIKQFTERAIKEMVVSETETQWHCAVCGRVYHSKKKSTKAIKGHIHRNHGNEVACLAVELKKEADEVAKEWCRESIKDWFPKIEKSYEEAKAHFIEKLQSDSFEHTLRWKAESVTKHEFELKLARTAHHILNEAPEEEWLKELTEYREKLAKELIEQPYRHNSTCGISNQVSAWEVEAKAEFVRRSGLYNLNSLIYYVENLQK